MIRRKKNDPPRRTRSIRISDQAWEQWAKVLRHNGFGSLSEFLEIAGSPAQSPQEFSEIKTPAKPVDNLSAIADNKRHDGNRETETPTA
jgi:hypothetical protein